MAILASDLFDALTEAGASREKAKKASEEVASFDNKVASMDAKITMLQWMLGINIAMTASIIFKLLSM